MDFEAVGLLARHVVASMEQVVDIGVGGASSGMANTNGAGVLLVDNVGGAAGNGLAVGHGHGHVDRGYGRNRRMGELYICYAWRCTE